MTDLFDRIRPFWSTVQPVHFLSDSWIIIPDIHVKVQHEDDAETGRFCGNDDA